MNSLNKSLVSIYILYIYTATRIWLELTKLTNDPSDMWRHIFSMSLSRILFSSTLPIFGNIRTRCYSSRSPPPIRPGPPRLPFKEQQEWEDLIRRNQSGSQSDSKEDLQLHPDARRPVQPDFEGETNPITGEIGGPTKEPLQWGPNGEWTYGGRSTDF